MACWSLTEGGWRVLPALILLRARCPKQAHEWPCLGLQPPCPQFRFRFRYSILSSVGAATSFLQSPLLQRRILWWSCWGEEIWGECHPGILGRDSDSLLLPPWSSMGEWVVQGTCTQKQAMHWLCEIGQITESLWVSVSLPIGWGGIQPVLVSYIKPSGKAQSKGNAGNSQTVDFPVLVGGDSSVSAELNHVTKFSIISSLFGKFSQSIFSLSQMSFNYALTHDYGHNPSDNLTICVKLGENAQKY